MPSPSPISILIVEDELIVAESLSLDLQRKGYAIAGVVSSGEEAIDAMTLMQPDLILMDIMLKGFIDGIETSRMIQHRQAIPIIYITAFSDAGTLARAKQAGETLYYLVKPIRLKDLIKTIEAALEGTGLSTMVSSPASQTVQDSDSPPWPSVSTKGSGKYDEIDLSFFDAEV